MQEEELMARVPLSKAEHKNLKAQRRAGLSGGIMLDDFADDVADLVQVSSSACPTHAICSPVSQNFFAVLWAFNNCSSRLICFCPADVYATGFCLLEFAPWYHQL
jgi:hypothetical protein